MPRSASLLLPCVAVALVATVLVHAQAADPSRPDTQTGRVDARLRALQLESEQLAREAQTLLGDLRKLEIERDLRVTEASRAEDEAAAARQALEAAGARLAALEQQRLAQLPDIEAHLVDIYKRGNPGYGRLLFDADDMRDFARATRAVAALVTINQRRIADHRQTLAALAQERTLLERTAAAREAHEAAATAARRDAERAVDARTALLARIDSRRDLTAQYVGELQVAYDRLQRQVSSVTGGRTTAPATGAAATAIPLAPFRGALDWPASGQVTGRFGPATDRLGGTAVRNGIEIAAAQDAPVRAVHGGTVAFADAFTGLGTLVIVDHGGSNYSLYGYLGATAVDRGEVVDAGAELGHVGLAPAGPAALYFEIRIDGRSVDPVQWLRPR